MTACTAYALDSRSGGMLSLSRMALTRSEQMARIRASNTTPERLLRRSLWRAGLRYRLHVASVCGKPDLVFPRERVAVFIDGCFWHGCPDHYVRPRTRDDFWADKLSENVARDRRQTAVLKTQGWRVCRIWEHRVFEDLQGVVREIALALKQRRWRPRRHWCVVRVDPLGGTPEREQQHLMRLDGRGDRLLLVRERTTTKWSRRTSDSASSLRSRKRITAS
jgi:DNA mismatch endonuclease (patch repair protein)